MQGCGDDAVGALQRGSGAVCPHLALLPCLGCPPVLPSAPKRLVATGEQPGVPAGTCPLVPLPQDVLSLPRRAIGRLLGRLTLPGASRPKVKPLTVSTFSSCLPALWAVNVPLI